MQKKEHKKKKARVFLGVTENIRRDKRNQQMVKEEMDNQ
jgi:hypothetical protein